jgi:MFS family permease
MSRIADVVAPRRMGSRFRWLLGSSWTSNLADGIGLAAGPLLVASQTSSPLLVALATMLQQLPWLLFGLHAGVVADRLDRRAIVITVDIARAVVLVVLAAAIATDIVSVGIVLVAMFLLGTAETFADTTTGTLLPMIVDPSDLGDGNARLVFGSITINRMAGPPIGALLFAAGMALPFVTQAIALTLAAILIRRIGNARPARLADESSVHAEIAAGIRWVRHHPAIRTLVVTVVSFNITFGATWSIMVLYVTQRLGLGSLGFGLVTTASAAGGVLGTVVYGPLARAIGPANIMRAGLVVETLTHLSLASTTNALVALPVFFVFGIHEAAWSTTASTIRQRAVPEHLQGRVSSVELVGVFGSLVVGATLGGVIADVWGITGPFWFAFFGSVVLLAALWRSLGALSQVDEAPSVTLAP